MNYLFSVIIVDYCSMQQTSSCIQEFNNIVDEQMGYVIVDNSPYISNLEDFFPLSVVRKKSLKISEGRLSEN